jgi:6-phosphogluconolactonase
MRIEVLPTAVEVAAATAAIMVEVARGGGHIALSGGSTPGDAYREAAAELRDWRDTTLWFGDDRAVGPEHPYSNYRMVDAALLCRLPDEGRPTVRGCTSR